MHMSAMK